MKIYRMNAELRIPYAHLVMLPRGSSAVGQVRIVVMATDTKGSQSDLTHQTVPIEIPADKLEEAKQKGYFAFRFVLEIEGAVFDFTR